MRNHRAMVFRIGRVGGFILILIAVSGSAAWLGASSARQSSLAKGSTNPSEPPVGATLQRVGADELIVPPEVAAHLGLRTSRAVLPSQPRTLPPFSGILAIDNAALSRIYSRFPGEVVALGTAPEAIPTALTGSPPPIGSRPLRVGDRVVKGQTLAVVSSTLLGEKKSELVDALSKLRRDRDVLASLRDPATTNAVPPRSIRDAERDVESDRVAVGRAELTLRSWRLSEDEIAAIREEAAALSKPGGAKRPDPEAWPRSIVSSPRDGTIVELNTNPSAIADTTTPLFLVADLSQLAVWAHVYEEDLPLLQVLPRPVRWSVHLPSRPGSNFTGTLDSIGAAIHPDQHTALVSGTVANPDGSLRAGMFAAVSVALPPPPGEVEVPAEAVVEDGRESLVFVRSPTNPTAIARRHVKVARRFHDAIYLAAEASGIQPGDEVITSGSLLLSEGMNELPAPRP